MHVQVLKLRITQNFDYTYVKDFSENHTVKLVPGRKEVLKLRSPGIRVLEPQPGTKCS